MLKALELVGFKSFADKTRFEFPDGITVVVGPNGSGKSNVVDAVKWVLGAQSAKALRGADMADVIFKGSAEGGRKPANSAEVVLVLDNTSRIFHHDSEEVHVSRRVFRSGEGEYAINGQPCRLKDVKDLFRGTGVGVDAYSLIEQGKVDRLLQASAKDRRGIFEEAAGISRFKAKKVEAERRMQRVDQNLVRLGDIVDEVGKRLQTLKSQATKAQRYREITHQLTTQRWNLGWIESRLLEHQRNALEIQRTEAITSKEECLVKWKELEESAAREKNLLDALQSELVSFQNAYLNAEKEAIAAESGYKTAIARSEELEIERSLIQERLIALQERASSSVEETQTRQREIESIQQEQIDAIQLLSNREADLDEVRRELEQLNQSIDSDTATYNETQTTIHTLRSKIVSFQYHIEQLQNSIETWRGQESQLRLEWERQEKESTQLSQEIEQARVRAATAREGRSQAEQSLEQGRKKLFENQEQLAAMQGKLHGVRERLSVLAQLEDQFAGDGRGGQQLLRLARANQDLDLKDGESSVSMMSNPWHSVRGLVADILSSEMHLAPLIDVALGHLADAIVLSNGQIVDWIHEGALSVDGRVTLLRLDRLPNRRTGEKIQLDGLRGIIGRADRLTQYAPEYEPLIRALLGTTWFVDSLATALELSHFRGAGLRFVTAECQLVDSDGSITIGSLQAGLGLISRRTEMQMAREEILHLESELEQATQAMVNLQESLAREEQALKQLAGQEREASQELSRVEVLSESNQERRSNLLKRIDEILSQIANGDERILDAENQSQEADAECQHSELAREEIDVRLHSWREKRTELQSKLKLQESLANEQKIQVARLEQRLDGLKLTLDQLVLDASEREKNVSQASLSLAQIDQRIQESKQHAARCLEAMGELRATATNLEAQRIAQLAKIDEQNNAAGQASRQFEQMRRQLDKNEDKLAQITQNLQQIDSQVAQLREHYAAEYQIHLPQDLLELELHTEDERLSEETAAQLQSIAAVSNTHELQQLKQKTESEIAWLRSEIASTGSVNMEALAELDALQSRYDRLAGHQSDLIEAKNGLLRTMTKIDEDSRHLFVETLQAIRKNFQDLYRRSFGGGFADILLENENDPDSGIEIIATPPGKTTLSNSLLSGGEKALTAVALIMAFFQYRPSPFCILDEVDAPFDEANIGRFVTVLREFLSTTKFIVVTHSKKTMTAANMIYGVTMQESGVSRQVSVRFEEVNEKGEILTKDRKLAA
ncbi:Chromosome partition protein Smc [Pirellula sp. SH-Sr6A]|uniref:chromosome segregation protein SMC n=1 Tax=Pirellula sp. SH-Sr6A TaxID=1632865 RepID=UPI00078D60FF|nr:chromosome segregation protein SMC [Pirellula sp. SH-Sr6A]AMV32263.1 Chromosome partition protein Smc [Pirellula sp. SH-Sr6A]